MSKLKLRQHLCENKGVLLYLNLFYFQTIYTLPENAEMIASLKLPKQSQLGFKIKWYLKYTPSPLSGTAKDKRRVFFGIAIIGVLLSGHFNKKEIMSDKKPK